MGSCGRQTDSIILTSKCYLGNYHECTNQQYVLDYQKIYFKHEALQNFCCLFLMDMHCKILAFSSDGYCEIFVRRMLPKKLSI